MRVSVAGRELEVDFQHEQFESPKLGLRVSERQPEVGRPYEYAAETTCRIRRVGAGKRKDWPLVGKGWARCSVDDRFQKEVGRALSLVRAVEDLNRVDRGALLWMYHNRNQRVSDGSGIEIRVGAREERLRRSLMVLES